jgi:hypothetical protein
MQCPNYAEVPEVPRSRYRCGVAGVPFQYADWISKEVVPKLLLTVKLLGAEVISRKRKAQPAEHQVYSVAAKQIAVMIYEKYQDLRWG